MAFIYLLGCHYYYPFIDYFIVIKFNKFLKKSQLNNLFIQSITLLDLILFTGIVVGLNNKH